MARIIAFYLPQFHPTENNDKWYGKGFTEWTNVAAAKPLFIGHKQPHIPADLGFYDLRLKETQIEQAKLAKQYGVEGFCYYYYRFNKNHHELDIPFNNMVNSGTPDFPFMICWANETWMKKMWNKDGTVSSNSQILAMQSYDGLKDYEDFFYELLPIFKDSRYIKIHNKPAFMIYKPFDFKDCSKFISLWNRLAKDNGLEGIFFIGQSTKIDIEKQDLIGMGFNAIQVNCLREYWRQRNILKKIIEKIGRVVFKLPLITSYKKASSMFVPNESRESNVYPTIIPNWDHTPRTGRKGNLLYGSTPELFLRHLNDIKKVLSDKNNEDKVTFLMAWNEWGEGNYIEPDRTYGHKYLECLKKVLGEI